MKIDGKVVSITIKLWNDEGTSIEFESYNEEDDHEPTNAPPKYSLGNYPCDGPDGFCPFDAQYNRDCRYWCGLGV